MLLIVKENYEAICRYAADRIEQLVKKKPDCILGLATGSTPLGLYRELIRRHHEENLDFSMVQTFNLDEYVGLPKDHNQSYYYFMKENLFDGINIKPENTHIPDGMAKDIEEECLVYEKLIIDSGGIDLQVLGIGENGHIAFNEPFSSLGSRTRIKTLTQKTREDNARFFNTMDEVPKFAFTMGVGTIMDTQSILLLANGTRKASAIAKTVEGAITAKVPATMVQMHRHATIIIDEDAASLLTQSLNIAE